MCACNHTLPKYLYMLYVPVDDKKTQELTLREREVAVEERKLKQGDDKLAAADANCDVSSANSCWTNNSMSGYLAPKELCP